MMLRAPFKKTLVNNLFGIAIFYSFLVFLLILVPLVLRLFPQLEQNIMMNGGFEMFSLIFIFVLALTTVKDNLYASMVLGEAGRLQCSAAYFRLLSVQLFLPCWILYSIRWLQ